MRGAWRVAPVAWRVARGALDCRVLCSDELSCVTVHPGLTPTSRCHTPCRLTRGFSREAVPSLRVQSCVRESSQQRAMWEKSTLCQRSWHGTVCMILQACQMCNTFFSVSKPTRSTLLQSRAPRQHAGSASAHACSHRHGTVSAHSHGTVPSKSDTTPGAAANSHPPPTRPWLPTRDGGHPPSPARASAVRCVCLRLVLCRCSAADAARRAATGAGLAVLQKRH
jgi:hypothetical protein